LDLFKETTIRVVNGPRRKLDPLEKLKIFKNLAGGDSLLFIELIRNSKKEFPEKSKYKTPDKNTKALRSSFIKSASSREAFK